MTYLNKCVFLLIFMSPMSIADTLLDDLSMCAKNNDSLQRLVCYDKLAKDTKSSQPKQPQAALKDTTVRSVGSVVQVAQKTQSETVLAVPELSPKKTVAQPQSTGVIANTVKQQQTSFGKEDIQRPEDLVQRIEASIIKVKKAHHGKLIITLDNGQVWRQTDSTRLKLRKDNVVIINRGALGSFFIGKKNANKRIRAKRVK